MTPPDDKSGIPDAIALEPTQPIRGVFLDMDRHLGAAETLRQWGDPSIAQAARDIARSKLGWAEIRGLDGKGTNTGPICTWSYEGLYAHDGDAWCADFACQCVRRALLALDPKIGGPLLVDWKHWATGDCDKLWANLSSRGLTEAHEIGATLPPDSFFVFFQHLAPQTGAPITHSDGRPNVQHVGIVDRIRAADVMTLEGNSADAVAERSHMLADRRILGVARLPW